MHMELGTQKSIHKNLIIIRIHSANDINIQIKSIVFYRV